VSKYYAAWCEQLKRETRSIKLNFVLLTGFSKNCESLNKLQQNHSLYRNCIIAKINRFVNYKVDSTYVASALSSMS